MPSFTSTTAAAAVAVVAVIASGSFAEAACNANVPLCGANGPQVPVANCANQTVSTTMGPCCAGDSLVENECPENPQPVCRTQTLSQPFVNELTGCCSELTLDFKWEYGTEQCCRECSCFGDPHCISFQGVKDTWVLCDGRTKNEKAVFGELACPIMKKACEQQVDHLGNQCKYNNAGFSSFAESGSPCQSTFASDAIMNMYSFEGFGLNLFMGERAIIAKIQLISNGQEFILNAATCINQPTMPWRDANGEVPADPEWLPKTWTREKTSDGQRWKIFGLESGIEISLRCIRHPTGKVSRINVERLGDPKPVRRDQAGVCVSGEIDTGLSSTQHTDVVQDFCSSRFAEEEAKQVFCDASDTKSQCRTKFCRKYYKDDVSGCVSTLASFLVGEKKDGYERLFCAANTIANKDPASCLTKNGPCLQCYYDVQDFGWTDAVKRWEGFILGNTGGNSGPKGCLTWEQLNTTLGDCADGVYIQALNTEFVDENDNEEDCWETLKAIPSGYDLCTPKVLDTRRPADQAFFNRQLRIRQCADPSCSTENCVQQAGPQLSLTSSLFPIATQTKLYWQLWREGKLICNPANPPNECLANRLPAEWKKASCSTCFGCSKP